MDARGALPELTPMEEMIKRMAAGEKNAMAEIYNEASASVYGFVLSILRNTHDAEDVLQDTFIKLWSASSGYMPQGKPMAWILTIAKNLAMSRLREHKRSSDIPEDEWQMLYVESPAVTSEDRLVLESALKGLSDDDRQIVMLHAVSGMKHAEIAEMLDMPLSTVLSKYSRARKKLKSLIEGGEQQ